MYKERALELIGNKLLSSGFTLETEDWQTLKAIVLAQQTTNSQNDKICQLIVEDVLNHLIRNKYLVLTHIPTLRDELYGIVSGKLHT